MNIIQFMEWKVYWYILNLNLKSKQAQSIQLKAKKVSVVKSINRAFLYLSGYSMALALPKSRVRSRGIAHTLRNKMYKTMQSTVSHSE